MEVILLTAKVDQLEGKRDDTRRAHDEIVHRLRVDTKASDERIGAERNSVLSRYYGALRSVRDFIKAADERHTGHADTLTQLRLSFEEGRNVREVAFSAGPSLETLMVVVLVCALDALKLELQTLSGIASENLTIHLRVSRLSASVEMLDRKRREIMMPTQGV